MFELTETPLETIVTRPDHRDEAGAVVIFEGRVRNHNNGKEVSGLEYSAYPALANKEGARIIGEAIAKFDVIDIKALHRIGSLEITELAVWIQARAKHRKEAFLACQYAIDEIKKRVPIWKKEHYLNAPSEWVACHQCAGH